MQYALKDIIYIPKNVPHNPCKNTITNGQVQPLKNGCWNMINCNINTVKVWTINIMICTTKWDKIISVMVSPIQITIKQVIN